MTKKLNENAVASELSGSAFFDAAPVGRAPVGPMTKPSLPTTEEASTRNTNGPLVRASHRPDASTAVSPSAAPRVRTPVRRVIRRYAFEFFQDQVEQLRRMSLEQKLQGEDGSMSEMVRDALDTYLAGREEPKA